MGVYNSYKSNNTELSNFKLSPNPASSYTMISVSEKDDNIDELNSSFELVEIYNKVGVLKNKYKFPKNTLQAKVDVSNLLSDVYIVRIFNGKNWEEHKLVVLN